MIRAFGAGEIDVAEDRLAFRPARSMANRRPSCGISDSRHP